MWEGEITEPVDKLHIICLAPDFLKEENKCVRFARSLETYVSGLPNAAPWRRVLRMNLCSRQDKKLHTATRSVLALSQEPATGFCPDSCDFIALHPTLCI